MNGELLIPAGVALGGGTTALGAILVHEHRRADAMRRSRKNFELTFPASLEPKAAIAALSVLAGARYGTEFVFEVRADRDGIRHSLAVPEPVASSVVSGLSAALPGMRARSAKKHSRARATFCLRVFVPNRATLSTGDPVPASRALLGELARLDQGEEVALRWALRTGASCPAPEDGRSAMDRRLSRALQEREHEPGFDVSGLVVVRAGSIARARALAEHVAALYRSRRGLGPGFRFTADRGNRTLASLPRATRASGRLSVAELLPVLGLPVGPDLIEGVRVGATRERRASRALAREGRRLFLGRDGRGTRPVALSEKAALLHTLIVGPTGSGKSTMLARGVLDDLAAGRGGIVIDSKRDTYDAIAERVPHRLVDRVVMLDPADPGPVPGLDLFGSGDPDLRSDVVLGALRSIFADSWGPRSEQYGRLGLRTLSEMPGATLTDFGRLFSDASFRRDAVAHQSDPVTVAAWQSLEALSPAAQAEYVRAPLAKVDALISRPSLRAVVAQSKPRLDIGALLSEKKLLLVSLAPGTLGEPAARLLGAVVTFLVWTALEERVTLRPDRRPPVSLVFDELQVLTDLPLSLERIAERARGLGGGLVIGTQTIGRLPESTRQALLGNVGSLVVFRTGAEDAARLARGLPGLEARDIQSLGSYEVAARVATGEGGGGSVATGYTEPLPKPTGMGQVIRARSAARYGVDRAEIDAELRARYGQTETPEESPPVGRTRRRA